LQTQTLMMVVKMHWVGMQLKYICISISGRRQTMRKTSANYEVINEKAINKAVTATLGFTL